MAKERLQKVLARAGLGSRRMCEKLITEGRVTVNGEVRDSMPVMVDPQSDRIEVDGEKIKATAPKDMYVLLNKPKGIVCTVKDELGRRNILSFLPTKLINQYRLFPVGRLDKDSQGLVLLTNDGELTKRLTHPRHSVPRTYRVAVNGPVDGTLVERMTKGIWLSDGKARALRVKIIKRGRTHSVLEITLTEGKNRQIRRMLAKCNLSVKKLERIGLGTLQLKGVGEGKFRFLDNLEVKELKSLVNMQ